MSVGWECFRQDSVLWTLLIPGSNSDTSFLLKSVWKQDGVTHQSALCSLLVSQIEANRENDGSDIKICHNLLCFLRQIASWPFCCCFYMNLGLAIS